MTPTVQPTKTILLPCTQVGNNESFYLTFLRDTVGILSLDALELSPIWDNSIGGTSNNNDHRTEDTTDSVSAGSGSGLGGDAKVSRAGSSSNEVPLLGEAQWQRLRKILEGQVNHEKRSAHCARLTAL